MHSRLYTRVLNAHPWMHNCTALNSIYNSTGLVGIFASAESSQAGEMVDVLCKEIQVGGWVAGAGRRLGCQPAVARGVLQAELRDASPLPRWRAFFSSPNRLRRSPSCPAGGGQGRDRRRARARQVCGREQRADEP